MTLKKLSAMLVSCTLAGTLFTGCGGDTSQTQQPQGDIKLGMLKTLNSTETQYGDIMKKFEENADIKLTHHTVIFYNNLESLQVDLKAEKIDEISIYDYTADYLMASDPNIEMAKNHAGKKKIIDNITLALRAEDTELKNSLDAAINSMGKDGTLENFRKIYITDLKMDADPPAVAFENFDGAETLKVGVTGDLPPVDLVLADGKPAGFNTAVLSEIGKRLQKNIEVVKIDAASRATALTSKQIDIAFWAIVPTNEAVALDIDKPQGVELSAPYLTGDVVHVALKK